MSTTAITVNVELETKALAILERVPTLQITSQNAYDAACSCLRDEILPSKNAVIAELGAAKEKTFAAHKDACDRYNRFVKPWVSAETGYKLAIGNWEIEQERVRQEEQRRLDTEAHKREEEDRLEAAAAAQEGGATEEEVDAILEEQLPVAAAVATPTFQRAEGIFTRESWRGEVTNKMLLVKFVAANPHFLNLLDVNGPALNALAKAQRTLMNVPGARAVRETSVAARTK